jgi:hypothetical protein
VQYDGAKPQNCIVEKFCTMGNQSLLSLLGTSKKKILSTSNIIISQFVQSTFLKLFAHVPLVVYGKILQLKFQFFKLFLFLLLELEMVDFSIFLRKMTFVLLGLNKSISCKTKFWKFMK